MPIPADFVGLSKDWTYNFQAGLDSYHIGNSDICDNTLFLSTRENLGAPSGIELAYLGRSYFLSLGKIYGYPSINFLICTHAPRSFAEFRFIV